MLLSKIWNNIQLNQTLVLSSILIIGVEFYWLDISYLEIVTTFFSVILLDLLFIKYNSWKWVFPFSWVNAWFWISFFLRSDDLAIYFFAAFLAIFWKHIFTINKKHFMNPSNMWVFLTLLLFPWFSWVNTLQWWNYTWSLDIYYISMLLLTFTFWFFMCYKVYKTFNFKYIYDLILPFIILHFLLFFIILVWENFTTFKVFFSISFFIFTFFMFTDPKTVPKTSLVRVFYSISIVFTFYFLQFFINENYSILWALFLNTLLLPIVWNTEKLKSSKAVVLYLILISIILISLVILIYLNGRPDLVFDNLCNQIICK